LTTDAHDGADAASAVEILRSEHHRITKMIECLEALAERATEAGRLDLQSSTQLLYLFETFADGQHQSKEEEVLFPELLRDASDGDCELLRNLLDDHTDDRRSLASMRTNLLAAVYGEPLSVRLFVKDASAYVRRQRAHMEREEAELFPRAEELLSEEGHAEVVEGFAELDANAVDASEAEGTIRTLHERLVHRSET
jgi:hemerythrin-like domain-containing protein